MTSRILAAAIFFASASQVFAQGIDSHHSPYPASAYSGYVPAGQGARLGLRPATAKAYRFSGQHAGGPANALIGG